MKEGKEEGRERKKEVEMEGGRNGWRKTGRHKEKKRWEEKEIQVPEWPLFCLYLKNKLSEVVQQSHFRNILKNNIISILNLNK